MASSESITVTVWVRTGSRFETDRVAGISHFLEHMVFKGSKKRPSARAISEAIDGIGGEFNANTTKEWTSFYIKTRPVHLKTALDVLSDMLINPLLKMEDIEREKGVIIQEINLYEDNPIMKIMDIFENVVYMGSNLSRDIIGTTETVKRIGKDDFVGYRKTHYYPENMLVSISGSVKPGDVKKLAGQYFSSLVPLGKKPEKPGDSLKQEKPAVLIKNKNTDQTHLILGFKGTAMGEPTRYAEALLAAILGGGMSSRLFTEIREKRGLAYSVRTTPDHTLDNGYFATYAGVKTEKVEEAVKVILDEHYKIVSSKLPISKEELSRAREYLKGRLALSLEDSKELGDFFALEELMLNETRTPKEVYESIDKVKVQDITSFAKKIFKPERLNLAIIGPFKEKGKFEKLLN